MAYIMFSAKHGDRLVLGYIKHTAREVREEIGRNFRGDEGGWEAAKKEGWRVVRVWVGLERRYG